MIIVATFANREHDPEIVELVLAWDEFTIDANPEGYDKERAEALASWGDDLFRSVSVEISFPMAQVYDVLCPDISIPARVIEVGDVQEGQS